MKWFNGPDLPSDIEMISDIYGFDRESGYFLVGKFKEDFVTDRTQHLIEFNLDNNRSFHLLSKNNSIV